MPDDLTIPPRPFYTPPPASSSPARHYAYWHPRRHEWVRLHNLLDARESAQVMADRYHVEVSVCSGGRPLAIMRPTRRMKWLGRFWRSIFGIM